MLDEKPLLRHIGYMLGESQPSETLPDSFTSIP
jgi:hypothetical protein